MAKEQQIITQAEAARLRGCSRERIRQKVGQPNGLRPVIIDGQIQRGKVYKVDVLNWVNGKHGRPRLTLEERIERNQGYLYAPDEIVLWTHYPRDGFGYSISVVAKIEKIGNKRVLISFKDADGKKTQLWTKAEKLDKIDNET